MLMNLIFWIVLGGIAGWIASMIADTNRQMGVLANVVVGIVGALLGGGIVQAFGGFGITGFNLYSLLVAILGAVIVLVILRLLGGFRTATSH